MKRIVILNGAAKKDGNTVKLINAFKEGVGDKHIISEFYLQDMNINGCLDCQACIRVGEKGFCTQKDDMIQIYEEFSKADIIVFASPMYWGTISGTLKTVVDRLYTFCNPYSAPPIKETVFLMTANSSLYQLAIDWYNVFQIMGWKSHGMALGLDQIEEAHKIGENIK